MWRSVRVRVTAIAVLAMVAVLSIGSVIVVLQQRAALSDEIDRNLSLRADDLEALLGGGDTSPAALSEVSERFAQVIGPNGDVVLATPNLVGEAALAFPGDLPLYLTTEVAMVDDDRFRVHGRVSDSGNVIYVGSSFDHVDESTSALVASLAVAWPVLLVSLAAVVWWLVGRTLAPVEAIRSEVAGFGGKDLHRRVPTTGSGDEIDRLAATMNEMLARIDASVAQQQRFVADASHELRSPLTRLRTQIEVGMRENPDRDLLVELRAEVLEMQRVVEDLLYVARLDAGEIDLTLTLIDLDDVVLRETDRVAMDTEVRIDVGGVSAADVEGDAMRLRRAVSNLIENAVRHASSQVTVSLADDGGWAVFTVGDDGPGVRPEHAEMIFERFARVDEARSTDLGGTGLGLAIAREIATAHGGSITLSNPGEPGAVFEMRVPAVPS